MIDHASRIPSWFKEGLAVVVSSGGGAESVSEAHARAAIATGNTFAPAKSGRLLFERSGRSYRLSEHMWYRQSAVLVGFLKTKDDSAFRRLIARIIEGDRFESAVEASYKIGIDDLVREFRSSVAALQPTEKEPSPTTEPVGAPAPQSGRQE
jgi:hypothetical protein